VVNRCQLHERHVSFGGISGGQHEELAGGDREQYAFAWNGLDWKAQKGGTLGNAWWNKLHGNPALSLSRKNLKGMEKC